MLLQTKVILDNFIFYSQKGYKSYDTLDEQGNIVLIFRPNSSFPYNKLCCLMHMEEFLAYSKFQQLLLL